MESTTETQSAPAKRWWDYFMLFFPKVLEADQCAALSHAWNEKGFTDQDAIEAVRRLASLDASKWPKWPLDFIRWLEVSMRESLLPRAARGEVPIAIIDRHMEAWTAELFGLARTARDTGKPFATDESRAFKRYADLIVAAKKHREEVARPTVACATAPALCDLGIGQLPADPLAIDKQSDDSQRRLPAPPPGAHIVRHVGNQVVCCNREGTEWCLDSRLGSSAKWVRLTEPERANVSIWELAEQRKQLQPVTSQPAAKPLLAPEEFETGAQPA